MTSAKRSTVLGLASLCSLILAGQAHAATFISEYVEGSSNNKALEIINTGAQDVDLSACELLRYSNGSSSGVSIPLNGVLSPDSVYVICNPSFSESDIALCDETSGSLSFNGDDAMELRCDGVTLDVVGQIGNDPGSQWGSGEASTKDNTICRKASVTQGDADGSDAFDPADEWIGFPSDTFSGLGNPDLCGGGVQPSGLSCSAPIVTIGDVQGRTDVSPVVGSVQTVRGVVSAVFPDLNGFFLQNTLSDADGDPETSDAIWVENPTGVAVSKGQSLVVQGSVSELYGRTQLSAQEISAPCGSGTVGVTMIDPRQVDNWERYEGMIVRPSRDVVISGNYTYERFNELTVAGGGLLMQPTEVQDPGPDAVDLAQQNATRSFKIDDASNTQNLFPLMCEGGLDADTPCRAGSVVDALSVQGPLDYGFGSYRIRDADSAIELAQENARPRVNPSVGNPDVRVGVFNVLNYFVTVDAGGASCGPSNLGCRGADSAQELERQAEKLVFALDKFGVDLIALQEVENPRTGQVFSTTAVKDLVNRLNALPDPRSCPVGQWQAVDAQGPLGTDAISNAIIYCSGAVRFLDVDLLDDSDLSGLGLSDLAPVFDGPSTNRVVLGARFSDIANNRRFSVAVTHQKSKGSSSSFRAQCEGTGNANPNCDQGDGAGYYNQMRANASTAIRAWLETNPKLSADFQLVVGDVNAYSKEDPVQNFVDAGYVDLAANEAPSYAFDGRWGHLDHAFANAALAPRVTAAKFWDINARESGAFDYNTEYKGSGNNRETEALETYYAADEFRSSDHNPLMVGLCLREDCLSAPTPRPGAPGAPLSGGFGLAALGLGLAGLFGRRRG